MKTIRKTIQLLLVLVAFAIGYSPTAGAELLFSNFQPAAESGAGTDTYANQFRVGARPIRITALGVYDFIGLSQDTPVGIWRVDDKALMGSVIVSPGQFTHVENWLFVDVTPFTLDARTNYRIGAQNMGSGLGWDGTFVLGKGIGNVADGFYTSPVGDWTFTYPSKRWLDDGQSLAANAQFSILPVPEPAEWAMLLAGLLVIGFMARRRNENCT